MDGLNGDNAVTRRWGVREQERWVRDRSYRASEQNCNKLKSEQKSAEKHDKRGKNKLYAGPPAGIPTNPK